MENTVFLGLAGPGIPEWRRRNIFGEEIGIFLLDHGQSEPVFIPKAVHCWLGVGLGVGCGSVENTHIWKSTGWQPAPCNSILSVMTAYESELHFGTEGP
jgi:hypothetical protein